MPVCRLMMSETKQDWMSIRDVDDGSTEETAAGT